ncbi:helix-turn-helix domain-containing protein [Erythrobacter sp. EC-HK427]|uniref:helix-turn-helix domain-containing protein n=1 Tax=Erythrobacter sp. EC-HK427 TaxID=2038396 RepID=UPI001253C12C|nr:helix-turn-helix transcriptional regulator [Erythrobacter sp. EC-HK427]VVT09664.1 conserved hypothetical protein [Erythrobacter sp. EC-HK427]
MQSDAFSSCLTRRQKECMEWVTQGFTAKHIARELNISHRTVEQHIAAAIGALGAKNRLDAVTRYLAMKRQKAPPVEDAPMMLRVPSSPVEADLIACDVPATKGAPKARAEWPLLPRIGGSANQAPIAIRLGWIVRIALCAMMLTCAAILSILGLIEMAQ